MSYKNCNYNLTIITISIIISLIFTLLFYFGIITNAVAVFIFSLALSLLTFLITGILSLSDNGLTKERLCRSSINIIISVLGSIFTNLFALTIAVTAGSIWIAVLVAFSTFFFVFNLINLVMTLIFILRY